MISAEIDIDSATRIVCKTLIIDKRIKEQEIARLQAVVKLKSFQEHDLIDSRRVLEAINILLDYYGAL